MLALDVGEARFQLFKGRADQFAEQFFGAALGVHLGDSGQARSGLDVQVDRVLGFGQATLRVLFPMLGQFSNFHGNLNKPAMAGGDGCPVACVGNTTTHC